MKNRIAAALIAATAIATPAMAQRAPAASIIVVNSERIYRDCNACRTAQTQLQSQVTTLRTRQQTLEGQLRPEGQAIQTAVNALGGKQADAALQNRVKAFEQRQDAANQELAKGQQNIQSIQANVVRQINEKLRPAINTVMTQKGANIAVDEGSTLAHSQATDATNEVLAALNTALPTVSLTPLPQQAQPQQTPTPGR